MVPISGPKQTRADAAPVIRSSFRGAHDDCSDPSDCPTRPLKARGYHTLPTHIAVLNRPEQLSGGEGLLRLLKGTPK